MANAIVTYNNTEDIVQRDTNFNLDFSITKPDSATLTETIPYTAGEVTGYGEYTVQASIEIEKSKWESITSFDIDETNFYVTGLKKIFFRYKVFIEETNTILKNFTTYYNQSIHDTSIVITEDNFATWNPYSIKITVEQDNGTIVNASKTFSVYNTSPYVSLFTVTDNMINLSINDYELDKICMKLTLNGNKIYPTSNNEYSSFYEPPFNFNLKVPKEFLTVNAQNDVIVYTKDEFDKSLAPMTCSFTGEYQAMLFYDLEGNVYTDDSGNINKIIDLGFFTSGNESAIKHIQIKNKLGFDVKDLEVRIFTDSLVKAGNIVELLETGTSIPDLTNIRLSKSEVGLADNGGLTELYFTGETFRNGDVRDIYFRVSADSMAMGRGSFRVNAKAIPV